MRCLQGVSTNIQVGIFVDTGADNNVVGRQWLSQLMAEGVLIEQHEEDIDLGWSIGDVGITVREKVRLRLLFIGCEDAPKDILEVFFITDNDFDWLTLGRASAFRIGILKHLDILVEVQARLGVGYSSGDL